MEEINIKELLVNCLSKELKVWWSITFSAVGNVMSTCNRFLICMSYMCIYVVSCVCVGPVGRTASQMDRPSGVKTLTVDAMCKFFYRLCSYLPCL